MIFPQSLLIISSDFRLFYCWEHINNTNFFPLPNFFYIPRSQKHQIIILRGKLTYFLLPNPKLTPIKQTSKQLPKKLESIPEKSKRPFPCPSPPAFPSVPLMKAVPQLCALGINRCQYDIIHDNMMIEQYFTKYYITIFHIFLLRDQPSTMQELIEQPIQTIQRVKFPKSSSMSSLKTEADIFFEKDLLTRKVSDQQKSKLITLITNENFNMKDAAKYVHISYSTAKKVFSRFRRARKEEMRKKIAVRRCGAEAGYRVVSLEKIMEVGKIQVLSTIAGAMQENNQENGIHFNE